MLTGHSTRLSFDDYISETIDIINGNNQGCPLSMTPYVFYNCPLIEIVKLPSKKKLVLGFINDVRLLAIGHDFTETHHTLKEMMERPGRAFEWSWTHNSPFELSKLAIVDFTLRKHKAANLPLFCRNSGKTTIVKAKNIYKFLGVLLEPNLKWSAQAESALATAAKWVNLIQRIAKTASRLSSKALYQLFLAVAILKMTYTTDIWYLPPHTNPTPRRNATKDQLSTFLNSTPFKGKLLSQSQVLCVLQQQMY